MSKFIVYTVPLTGRYLSTSIYYETDDEKIAVFEAIKEYLNDNSVDESTEESDEEVTPTTKQVDFEAGFVREYEFSNEQDRDTALVILDWALRSSQSNTDIQRRLFYMTEAGYKKKLGITRVNAKAEFKEPEEKKREAESPSIEEPAPKKGKR
jgi:hypothetical protein